MPLTIQVRSEQDDPPKLVFDLPRVVIGRSSGSDVRLPDTSVSQRHATIRQRGADYIVLDEGSTNGTFVGPVQLSPGAPRVVKSGDRIRVGRVWLEIGVDSGATPSGPPATKELALRLVAGALEADGSPGAPSIQVEAGPDRGATLVLNEFQRTYTLGRTPDCDLVLGDEDLSRRHLQVRRVGADVMVKDCASKNGSSLDQAPLDRERAWGVGQRVRAGQSVFTLSDPVQETLARIDSAEDERVEGEIEEPIAAPRESDPPRPSRKSKRAGASGQAERYSGAADDYAATPATSEGTHDDVPAPAPTRSPSTRRGRSAWNAIDLLVALVSLIVLGASIAGFVWLMGG
jgi:pSer/pThr/pTyr-binding forkhead associated (FHA) protein